ncbi:hypothetical protein BV898_10231 [Hypsibius exemplaris]|uniref:SGNH/GDSL hydrolase family protein n=1 Tax=Hypsibius exemplaris TaxID=2072580 RepID=A0A1W0WKB8_HYPEX|nr:hypothetical protein BV898_10231 [Hypsibius exemplaris]
MEWDLALPIILAGFLIPTLFLAKSFLAEYFVLLIDALSSSFSVFDHTHTPQSISGTRPVLRHKFKEAFSVEFLDGNHSCSACTGENLTGKAFFQKNPNSSFRSKRIFFVGDSRLGCGSRDYLIYETGAWTIFYYGSSTDTAKAFRRNLTQVAHGLARAEWTTPIWIPTIPFHSNVRKFRQFWVTHWFNNTDALIEELGQTIAETAAENNIPLWSSAHRLGKAHPELYRDQMHPGPRLLRMFACQLLSALEGNDCRR